MLALLYAVADEGFRLGLLATAYGFGFRHGFDWDHIAAITDITSSQEDPRQSVVLSSIYAAGHAMVVLVLGVVFVLLGETIPDSVDAAMGKVVGVTLVALGAFVFYSLIRHGRDFRMRSRWMLVFSGARRGARWLRSHRPGGRLVVVEVDHEHEHPADAAHHGPLGAAATSTGLVEQAKVATAVGHSHRHRHVGPLPDDPFANYGKRTALGVGMLHGIGAETPTQVLVIGTIAQLGGKAAGIAVLVAFLAGLFSSNSLVALASTFGFLNASRNFKVYAAIGVVTGVFSLVLGALLLLGKDALLPALFVG